MKAIASLATVVLLLAGVSLVGCGDDDDDTAATEATTTEEAADGGGGATEVSMTEYAFDPADLTVSKGDTVSVTNGGKAPHNYTVDVADPPPEGKPTTDNLDPGEQGAFGVAIDPGEYDVICTIPGHAEKGMKGTLTVE